MYGDYEWYKSIGKKVDCCVRILRKEEEEEVNGSDRNNNWTTEQPQSKHRASAEQPHTEQLHRATADKLSEVQSSTMPWIF